MSALKPCPFCGGADVMADSFGAERFTCRGCEADGPAGDTYGNRWNTRAPDPASRLADLEAEVERLNKAMTYEEGLTSRIGTHGPGCYMWGPNHYECLKAEVARLREALAGWMLKNSYATGHGDTFDDLLSELDWQHAKRTNP